MKAKRKRGFLGATTKKQMELLAMASAHPTWRFHPDTGEKLPDVEAMFRRHRVK